MASFLYFQLTRTKLIDGAILELPMRIVSQADTIRLMHGESVRSLTDFHPPNRPCSILCGQKKFRAKNFRKFGITMRRQIKIQASNHSESAVYRSKLVAELIPTRKLPRLLQKNRKSSRISFKKKKLFILSGSGSLPFASFRCVVANADHRPDRIECFVKRQTDFLF